MCELLGFTSAKPTDISDYLLEFFSHSIRHPHGWGIMRENNGREIFKEPVKACDSSLLPSVIKSTPPQKTALAHIRFATVGSIKAANCHPFTASDNSGREWTLIHNGTVFSGRNTHRYAAVQSGDTDSERLFLSMMDRINSQLEKGIPSERARFEMINDFIVENSPRNKLNLMIYDGDLLYVHKNLKNTLSFRRLGSSSILFATSPVCGGEWVPFPMAQVIAYKNGREVLRGVRHKGVFVPTLEYVTAMDAMYI